jgi:toxin YoeB
MKIIFAPKAWDDYLHWQPMDVRVLQRINELIKDASRNPFSGIGKPEALRYGYTGFWSRRVTGEHRMVYRIEGGSLQIAQLRYHY